MTDQKIWNLLGLAMKAGKIKSGEFATEKAVREGRAFLVIVASDASENTKKLFRNLCAHYQVPFYVFGEMEQNGHSIGRAFRASLACTEESLANAISKKLEQNESK